MNLERTVELALCKDGSPDAAAVAILSGNCVRRYALGKNPETLALHALAPLDGVIDDRCGEGESWHGIPVLRTAEADKAAGVVSCSTSIQPVAAIDHLRAAGFKYAASYAGVVRAAGSALPLPAFVTSQRMELAAHLPAWQSIHDALGDEESRQTLLDVLGFRLSADPEYMRRYSVRIAEQYFEDFMQYSNEVFVDAGGYDGDTTEAFAARHPDYRKVLFFEPSARNMASARTRLARLRDIEFFPLGLSDARELLRFNPESGSASSVSESGSEQICCDTLDAVVSEPVSFIKMDLEGWEMPALRGAAGHIDNDRPKLAIAIYHNAEDLRLVYQFVTEFGHGYRTYLRHYTQGWSETVLFFC
jgi:FkbM family methyltransferase